MPGSIGNTGGPFFQSCFSCTKSLAQSKLIQRSKLVLGVPEAFCDVLGKRFQAWKKEKKKKLPAFTTLQERTVLGTCSDLGHDSHSGQDFTPFTSAKLTGVAFADVWTSPHPHSGKSAIRKLRTEQVILYISHSECYWK